MIYRIFLILILFLLNSCEPEDGWCSSEKYSGDNNFNCPQMDDNFSCTGESVLNDFTDQVFVHRKSEVADGADFETVMERPEYIPETLTFTSMTSCTLAPRFGGVTCTSWSEFEFKTGEDVPVTASSKSGDNTVSPCSPKYLEFEFEEKTLFGIRTDSGLYLNDTVIKNGGNIKVRHYFTIEN